MIRNGSNDILNNTIHPHLSNNRLRQARPNSTADSVVDGFLVEAEAMLAADVATNKAIGDHGARRILELTGKRATVCYSTGYTVSHTVSQSYSQSYNQSVIQSIIQSVSQSVNQ
jgi:methylthioribose-1-phosphate isomerase